MLSFCCLDLIVFTLGENEKLLTVILGRDFRILEVFGSHQ